MSEKIYDRLIAADADYNLHPQVAEQLRGPEGAKGDKGDPPTAEAIKPVLDEVAGALIPPAVEEAVADLRPGVASKYPSRGAFSLEPGKSLHFLSLDGVTTLAFPESGQEGESIIIAVERGAQYLRLAGFEAPSAPSAAWITAVFDGEKWVAVASPTPAGGMDFTQALEEYRNLNHLTTLTAENFMARMVGIIGGITNSSDTYNADRVRSALGIAQGSQFWNDGQNLFSHHPFTGDIGGWDVFLSDLGSLLFMQNPLVEVLPMMRSIVQNFLYAQWNEGYSLKMAPALGWNGETLDGVSMTLGDAYEVVGLETGEPKLRIRIRPYDDKALALGDMKNVAHPHAGEVYEVALTRVSP